LVLDLLVDLRLAGSFPDYDFTYRLARISSQPSAVLSVITTPIQLTPGLAGQKAKPESSGID
jgi:hypothetical protein